jgi:hypothetical protein
VHSSLENSSHARREISHSKIKPKDDPFPNQPSSLYGGYEIGVRNGSEPEPEPEPEFEIEKKYTSNIHCRSAFSSRETSNKKIRRSDHPVLTLPSSLEGREELGVCNESEPQPEFEIEIEKKVHFKHPLPIGIYLYGNKQQKDSAI